MANLDLIFTNGDFARAEILDKLSDIRPLILVNKTIFATTVQHQDVKFWKTDAHKSLSYRIFKNGRKEMLPLICAFDPLAEFADERITFLDVRMAFKYNNWLMVNHLINNPEANDYIYRNCGECVIVDSTCSGNVNLVKLALKYATTKNIVVFKRNTCGTYVTRSSYYYATRDNYVEIVQLLLENNITTGQSGWPIVSDFARACKRGNIEIAKLLLASGNINYEVWGETFIAACKRVDWPVLKFLIEGASVEWLKKWKASNRVSAALWDLQQSDMDMCALVDEMISKKINSKE